MFRDSFDGFSPEVPSSVYSGVQKKLFWSTFLGFNASRLNIWYVLLATSAAAWLGWSQLDGETYAMTIDKELQRSTDIRTVVTASMSDLFVDNQTVNEPVQFSPTRSTSASSSAAVAEQTAPEVVQQTELVVANDATETVGKCAGMEIAETHEAKASEVSLESSDVLAERFMDF